MTLLVTGGAGYIGSHTVLRLLELGEEVVVLDDLSTGQQQLVPSGVRLVIGDTGDKKVLTELLSDHRVEAVIHFAGSIVVPESVTVPLRYYLNNTVKSRTLIEACVERGVRHFIFSSTAAVYGEPERVPVTEEAALRPINPDGRSKLMTEWMLEDASRAHGLGYVALRYFNVAGADPKGRSGQMSPRATHLIKVACEVATGKRPRLEIFGTDYPTRDGTCVRDYIHVTDLVEAHVAALIHLRRGGVSGVFNCGDGRGCTVFEVVAALGRVHGQDIPVVHTARRPGDSASLIADPSLIRKVLGWQPKHDDLDFIVRTALDWERKLQEDIRIGRP
jgi:UDP-glucose 4-epimerase